MKKRLFNFLLLITFQLGYLEWGKDKHMFVFEAEQEIFTKALTDFKGVIHPFILVPFLGIIILITTLFHKIPGRKLTLVGLACLSLLILMITLIGLLSLNVKMILSVLPFLITGSIVLIKK